MLQMEFYLQSATTLLLWLFQICSHEALALLILLGVLVVAIGLSRLGLSITRVIISIALGFLNIVLRKLFLRYFLSSEQTPPVRIFPALNSISLARVLSDSSSENSNSPRSNNRLTLPQYLALHPEQWHALEAAINNTTPLPESSAFNSLLDTTGQFSSASTRTPAPTPPTLRRSTRLRRPRNLCNL